jgi:hypothetical protein
MVQDAEVTGQRVFKIDARKKSRVVVAFVAAVALAVGGTVGWIKTRMPELALATFFTWVFVALGLRTLYRLESTITVDDESIKHSTLLGSVRINFKEVTDVKYLPEWQYLELRALSSKIVCHRGFKDVDLLLGIIGKKIPLVPWKKEEPNEEKDVTEFRYPRKLAILMVLSLLWWIGMAVFALCYPDPEEDFGSPFRCGLAAFFLLLAVGSVYGLYETLERILLTDDCLILQRPGKRKMIRYEEIAGITRKLLLGDEQIAVRSAGSRITFSRHLENYRTLVRRLEKIAPIRWKREELVKFPLTVPTRWWLGPAIGIPFGILVGVGCLYLFLDHPKSSKHAFCLIQRGAGICVGFGIFLSSTYKALKATRRYTFYPDRFVVTVGRRDKTYLASEVREVASRKWREGGQKPISGFDIRLDSETISLRQSDTRIPMTPLYDLLRRTYTPEDAAESPGREREE